MEPAFTPTMKWLLGLLTATFIGLGTWLGVIVYRNQPPLPATDFPNPVAMTLTEPVSRTETARETEKGIITMTEMGDKIGTRSQTETGSQSNPPAATTPPSATELPLTATVSIAVGGDRILVTVAANQSVAVGFETLASEYAAATTLTLDPFTDTRTLHVQSVAGQELTFDVSGSSGTVASIRS